MRVPPLWLCLACGLSSGWVGGTAAIVHAALAIGAVGTPVSQNFNSLNGGTNLGALNGGAWRWIGSVTPTFDGVGSSATLVAQTATPGSNSFGSYNFRDATATSDRAVGFIVSGAVSRSLMVEIENTSGTVLGSLTASWDLEKFRKGQQGALISFFHSTDGANWNAVSAGNETFATDLSIDWLTTAPMTVAKSATISGLNLAHGAKHYLRWDFARLGSDATGAIGLDNFVLTAGGVASVPEASGLLAVGLCAAGTAVGTSVRRRCAATRRRKANADAEAEADRKSAGRTPRGTLE